MKKFDFFHTVTKTLIQECYPLVKKKVVVRRKRTGEAFDGDCQLVKGVFQIRVNHKLPEYYAVDIFIHELSHAVAWSERIDHGPQWGIAYSKIYRMFLRKFCG